jgi:hypothetical protein
VTICQNCIPSHRSLSTTRESRAWLNLDLVPTIYCARQDVVVAPQSPSKSRQYRLGLASYFHTIFTLWGHSQLEWSSGIRVEHRIYPHYSLLSVRHIVNPQVVLLRIKLLCLVNGSKGQDNYYPESQPKVGKSPSRRGRDNICEAQSHSSPTQSSTRYILEVVYVGTSVLANLTEGQRAKVTDSLHPPPQDRTHHTSNFSNFSDDVNRVTAVG